MNSKSNIKRNRILIAFAVAVLFLISWYYMFNNSSKQEFQYNAYIEDARNYVKKQLYKKANISYQKALEMKNSLELKCEIAQMYYDWEKYYEYVTMVEGIISEHKKSNKGYELLIKYYYDTNDYEECVDLLKIAKSYNVSSEYLDEINEKLKYKYELGFISYANVKEFYNNLCIVQNADGYYGMVNGNGSTILSCKYMKLSPFVVSDITPATTDGKNYWLIDKAGDAENTSYGNELIIEDIGTFAEEKIPVMINGKYCYTDKNYNKLFGNYDEAYAFYNGKAMVKDGEKYFLINSQGDKVSNKTYTDVISDEVGYTCRSNLYAVNDGSGFYIIDENENKIGNETFEDVKLLNGDEYMAVKKEGQWGFCDKNGNIVIKPQYEEARSFANGLAAVKQGGLWGYIDKENNMVIEARFSNAKSFSQNGSAFICFNDEWEMLKLFR